MTGAELKEWLAKNVYEKARQKLGVEDFPFVWEEASGGIKERWMVVMETILSSAVLSVLKDERMEIDEKEISRYVFEYCCTSGHRVNEKDVDTIARALKEKQGAIIKVKEVLNNDPQ